MKIKVIPSILALALGALLGYGVFTVAGDDQNATLTFMASAVSFIICLILGLGVTYEDGRKGISLGVLSIVAAVVMAISHFAFAGFGIGTHVAAYLIVNGIILILYLLIFYGIYVSSQQ